MAAFKNGDIVLCINTEGFTNEGANIIWNYPQFMGVYTIEYVYPDGTVTLFEINLSTVNLGLIERAYTPEAAFYPWHFLKIHEPLEETIHYEKEEEVKL